MASQGDLASKDSARTCRYQGALTLFIYIIPVTLSLVNTAPVFYVIWPGDTGSVCSGL